MLFRILKTVTLTTISELDDSSKNLSCQEHHRLGLRWDTKAEKQRKALKEFTERQQAGGQSHSKFNGYSPVAFSANGIFFRPLRGPKTDGIWGVSGQALSPSPLACTPRASRAP